MSPILANIYLHELDEWLNQRTAAFNKGTKRRYHPEYKKLYSRYQKVLYKARDLKVAGKLDQAQELEPKLRQLKAEFLQCPTSDTHDPNYRRMRHLRYADDFVIGVIGSKADAVAILTDLHAFMAEGLKVELAAEKTGIVHASEGSRFLGYDIKVVTDTRRVRRTRGGTRRTMMSGIATLEWPMQRALRFACERGYIDNAANRRTRPRTPLLHLTEEEIAKRYIQELRGVSNYYSRAKNWRYVGNLLHWWCKDSLVKTLASKRRARRTRTYARLKMDDAIGIRDGAKVLQLLSPKRWKRYKTDNPDRKPQGSIPVFQRDKDSNSDGEPYAMKVARTVRRGE